MARGKNVVFIIGNVGADPEIGETKGGAVAANFRVAASRKYKDKAGELHEETYWANCVAYDKTAEVVRDFLSVGKQVAIQGRLTERSWDGTDGTKHYKTEILLDPFEGLTLLGGAHDEDHDHAPTSGSEADAPF